MSKSDQIRAVGYVRVSTEQQALEGSSLDAQRVRIQAHCIAMDIKLVEIISDEGQSAKSLDRPGIQKALKMLTQDKANALIVMKLDRLTRSVKDLGQLCEEYFGGSREWSLLSVSDAIDTRSASGKLILNVLTSVAQWEREAISDRTKESMQHMKAQGVILGAAPYGWKYIAELDAHGRRKLVESPEEQAGIKRICELYETDMYIWQICELIDAERVACRGAHWNRRTIYRVLARAGFEDPDRKPRKSQTSREQLDGRRVKKIVRDKTIAAPRAVELRGQGLSLRQIGEKLGTEGLLPPRGDIWHAASVLDLLRAQSSVSAA
jgi:DNA invertase Pin-like site-specific DNA recombinase